MYQIIRIASRTLASRAVPKQPNSFKLRGAPQHRPQFIQPLPDDSPFSKKNPSASSTTPAPNYYPFQTEPIRLRPLRSSNPSSTPSAPPASASPPSSSSPSSTSSQTKPNRPKPSASPPPPTHTTTTTTSSKPSQTKPNRFKPSSSSSSSSSSPSSTPSSTPASSSFKSPLPPPESLILPPPDADELSYGYPQILTSAALPSPPPSWTDLGLNPRARDLLVSALRCPLPTSVQQISYPLLARGADVLLHAPTGSGKTLAYLLPLLSRIGPYLSPAASEHLYGTVSLVTKSTTPIHNTSSSSSSIPSRVVRRLDARKKGLRALFILPTLELAQQLRAVLDTLLGPLGADESCRTLLGGAESSAGTQLREMKEDPKPIVIATPHRLLEVFRLDCQRHGAAGLRMAFNLKTLRCLVVDEVDMVLQPLSRYAPLRQKRNQVVHPPPGRVFLSHFLDPSPQSIKALLAMKRRSSKTTMDPNAADDEYDNNNHDDDDDDDEKNQDENDDEAKEGNVASSDGFQPSKPTLKPTHLQTVMVSATLSQAIRHGARRNWMRRLSHDPTAQPQPRVSLAAVRSMLELLAEDHHDAAALLPIHYVRAPGSFLPPQSVQHFYAVVSSPTPAAKAALIQRLIEANPQRGSLTGLLLFENDADMKVYSSLLRHIPKLTISSIIVKAPITHSDHMHLTLANFHQVRGLHFEQLHYLFLMDIPATESDYLHLSGRIGRMSSDSQTFLPGSVITLLSREQLPKLTKFTSTLNIPFHSIE